jgi:hypothetical protein
VVNGRVPHCYFLTVCSGSSVDQHTNNPSLFNLVEHIAIPPDAKQPPNGLIPLEVHAYWKLDPGEVNVDFHVRFVMVASTGLEAPSSTLKHRSSTLRFRTRTLGLPFPPVPDEYRLCVDFSFDGENDWHRQGQTWPINIRVVERKPMVTH